MLVTREAMLSATAICNGTMTTASRSVLRKDGKNFQSLAMVRKWSSVGEPFVVKASSATWMNGQTKNAARNTAAGSSRR